MSTQEWLNSLGRAPSAAEIEDFFRPIILDAYVRGACERIYNG